MTQVVDPESELAFVELSHPWDTYTPFFPGYEEIKFERATYHAKHGVMTHKFITTFHTSTHVNAPIRLIPRAPAVEDLALDRFFGSGVWPQGEGCGSLRSSTQNRPFALQRDNNK